MSDKVVKNPGRGNAPLPKVERYQPEYERLGLEPRVLEFDRQQLANQKPSKLPGSGFIEEPAWTQIQNEIRPTLTVEAVEETPPVEDDVGLETMTLHWENTEWNDLETQANASHPEFVLVNAKDYTDILATGTETEVKDILAEILRKTDLQLEDLVLFKRMKLKVGIFIED